MSERVLVIWTLTSRDVHPKADRVLDTTELEAAMLAAVTSLGFSRKNDLDAGLELTLDELSDEGLEGLRRSIYSNYISVLRASGHGDGLARDAFSRAYVTLYRFDERAG